jgi:hypothetical protein
MPLTTEGRGADQALGKKQGVKIFHCKEANKIEEARQSSLDSLIYSINPYTLFPLFL